MTLYEMLEKCEELRPRVRRLCSRWLLNRCGWCHEKAEQDFEESWQCVLVVLGGGFRRKGVNFDVADEGRVIGFLASRVKWNVQASRFASGKGVQWGHNVTVVAFSQFAVSEDGGGIEESFVDRCSLTLEEYEDGLRGGLGVVEREAAGMKGYRGQAMRGLVQLHKEGVELGRCGVKQPWVEELIQVVADANGGLWSKASAITFVGRGRNELWDRLVAAGRVKGQRPSMRVKAALA